MTKVVIFAGGLGTRLGEETGIKPKPMVEIGGKPILWHIMKRYSMYGFNDFIICLGYKGYVIKEYFANYSLHQSDVTIDLRENKIETHSNKAEPWKVTLLETGLDTMAGSRLKQVEKYIDSTFMLTYGDGISNINIQALFATHKMHGKLATMTTVNPKGRYGLVELGDRSCVKSFQEKPKEDSAWVNGGFFVLEPKVFDYIGKGSKVNFERESLRNLVEDNQLMAYAHSGFWDCMDTLRDKVRLDERCKAGDTPWLER